MARGNAPKANQSAATSAPSQSARLLGMVSNAEFFHSPEKETFGTVWVNNHWETWGLRSKEFTWYLRRLYFNQTKTSPRSPTIQEVTETLEAKALFEGNAYPVFTRVGSDEEAIYLDLGNDNWEVVKINADGWEVISDSPVRFRRSRGMQALPCPIKGDVTLDNLDQFLNLQNKEDLFLILGWLVTALKPSGPYPLLVLHGEQGSGKSTTADILRALVDPHVNPRRSGPRGEQDLLISARNSWVLSFDNLSYLPTWLSDALCRLSTGGGLSTRELYTNVDEVHFHAQRPIILNGIEELTTRPDLLDRSLLLYLPNIPGDQRSTETEYLSSFEEWRPFLLGALLDAVSTALRTSHDSSLSHLPRMADMAHWVSSAEPAWKAQPGTFIEVYKMNQSNAHALTLEASILPQPLYAFLAYNGGSFEGPADRLLMELTSIAEEPDHDMRRDRRWPTNPKALSDRLRRLSGTLRAQGIEIEFNQRATSRNRTRLIRIHCRDDAAIFASGASATTRSQTSSPYSHKGLDGSDAKIRSFHSRHSHSGEEVIDLDG